MVKLTKMEQMVLRGIARNQHYDGYIDERAVWTYAVEWGEVGKSSRPGVVSSLVKKGLVFVNHYIGEDPAIGFTQDGLREVRERGLYDVERDDIWNGDPLQPEWSRKKHA